LEGGELSVMPDFICARRYREDIITCFSGIIKAAPLFFDIEKDFLFSSPYAIMEKAFGKL